MSAVAVHVQSPAGPSKVGSRFSVCEARPSLASGPPKPKNSYARLASRMADWARYQLLSVCFVQRIADCAPPCQLRRHSERAILHLVVVDAERDEADALGLLAGQRVAREEVVLRLRHAAQQRPADRRVIAGGHAQTGMTVDDPGGTAHDRDVREDAGDQAGADCGTMDRRHDRLCAVDDVEHEVARLTHDTCAHLVVRHERVEQFEAATGGERLARPPGEEPPACRDRDRSPTRCPPARDERPGSPR